MSATAAAVTLKDLVNAELLDPDEPDPHAITDRILEHADDDQLREAARPGILALVLEGVRLRRSKGRGENGNGSGSGKGRSRRRREHDDLMQRFQINGEWLFYGDCTAADLLALAAEYRTTSIQASDLALRYEQEAQELKASGCATVRDLRERDSR